ncbi:multicopper oxidase family protein [Seohaeicola saemankumensis]|nr:multicopper oxidase family protein [Seohaeicola saemankumensis]MCA0871413.1 multicopper oxidase family protein [Seohaeicola saemankumensis]
MNNTRREFLKLGSSAAIGALIPSGLLASAQSPVTLTALPANVQLAPTGYPKTEIWGFDGTTPGTLIRVKQGETVRRRFVNNLPEASSVHWHGLRLENAMDGVAGLTQEAVPPGESFDYAFNAKDAGTFWYHAHTNSVEQVARGLYGPLIVDEPEAPDVDSDEVLILDDWAMNPETAQLDPDFTSRHDRSHAGRRGNYVTTNGEPYAERRAARNQRIRLRLINAANARIFQLGLDGLEGWIMALDGMPLAQPEPVAKVFLLAPGQRMDLFVDVTAQSGKTAHLFRVDDDEALSQVAFAVGDEAGSRRVPPPPLPENPDMDVPGYEQAPLFDLHMEGGAMGGLQSALFNGKRMSFRQLVDVNQFWSFNGTVGLTDAPLAAVVSGRTARVKIRNDTAFPHAMHLHGMHMREVLKDGGLGPLRDTVLLFGDDTREFAFVAGKPGKWIFHCHMLGHTASGMATWIDVT